LISQCQGDVSGSRISAKVLCKGKSKVSMK